MSPKVVVFGVQWCQKHHFFDVKNEVSKTSLFGENAYLILIVFSQMPVFAVFGENGRFLYI